MRAQILPASLLRFPFASRADWTGALKRALEQRPEPKVLFMSCNSRSAVAETMPAALVASYVIYLFILIGLGLAVVTAPNRTEQRPISLETVWQPPRIGVPREVLRPFLSYAITGFAVFALVGF